MHRKRVVGVVFGGVSGEHSVSLMSARSVMNAIPRDRFEVVPIGIDRDGAWWSGPEALEHLESGDANAQRVLLRPEPDNARLRDLSGTVVAELDVIFPVLHGPRGEDGTVQGLFELAQVPYVGCGVLASAVAMDKALFKDVMRAHEIPVLPHVLLTRAEITRDLDAAAARVTYDWPVFCKPANMGSSVGISRATNPAELRDALVEAARWDRRILVEPGVDAREVEFAVLGNAHASASVPGEIEPCAAYYDFAAKYESGDASRLLIPAQLAPDQLERLSTSAIAAFHAIDGAGLARVDFLIDKQTGEAWLNEINSLPGFTAISMYPKLWAATGVPYAELLTTLVDLALSRHAEESELARTRDA